MAFDFSTLVTDRTQQDVAYARQLAEKLVTGTATEAEIAEWNSFTLKGVYNHTDLNRVTAAMEDLKLRLEGYGYAVPGYQRIKVPHVLPEPEPTSRLPEGYLELTYIESTGAQYLDTGFKLNSNSRVVMDADLLDYSTNTYGNTFFGARSDGSTNAFLVICGKAATATWTIMYGNASGNVTLAAPGNHSIDFNKNVCTIDGVSASMTANAFSCDYPCFLFTDNKSGSANTANNARMKLYSCQIYDNGTLVRDYVPCINPSGDVGLYDLVTAAFFGNSGTGSFVAGAIPRKLPDGYTQVEYIQSTGTQYIDTGFKPNQDSRIDMVAQLTGTVGENNMLFGTRSSGTTEFFVYYHTAGTYYGRYVSSTLQVSKTFGSKVSVSLNKNTFTLDGSSVSTTYSAFQCTTNAVLFAWNNTGTISDKSAMKLYSCQIYDNGTLVRDYVPCKNASGVFGLYDLANDVFYQNAGTGTFVAGEEVVAPATASVMVVSDDVTEYDPYTWYEFDWPTPATMTIYLLNVSAIRAVLAVLRSTPEVPDDIERMMTRDANDIEAILLDVYRQLTIMPTTFIPCGEALCGGDNL